MENGGLATVTASQITHGHENDVSIETDSTEGSIAWRQEDTNLIILRQNGQPHNIYTRDPNHPIANDSQKNAYRLPCGHHEAFFEAFANVYTAAFDAMIQRASGEDFEMTDTVYPNVHDGTEGMHFIEQCVASSAEGGAWLRVEKQIVVDHGQTVAHGYSFRCKVDVQCRV